jgi:hypothetical protein
MQQVVGRQVGSSGSTWSRHHLQRDADEVRPDLELVLLLLSLDREIQSLTKKRWHDAGRSDLFVDNHPSWRIELAALDIEEPRHSSRPKPVQPARLVPASTRAVGYLD